EQLVDLVGRQPAAADQLAGQVARLGEASQQGARQLVALLPFEQRALTEGLRESAAARERHEAPSLWPDIRNPMVPLTIARNRRQGFSRPARGNDPRPCRPP